jgi:hypothetical protein
MCDYCKPGLTAAAHQHHADVFGLRRVGKLVRGLRLVPSRESDFGGASPPSEAGIRMPRRLAVDDVGCAGVVSPPR